MNWPLISALGSAIRHGGASLDDVPELLRKTLATGAWREFTTPRKGVAHHERFIDFVVTPPTDGLGTSEAMLRRICALDKTALDALDEALQNPVGSNQHSAKPVDNIHNLERPSGTSESAALRRLRKDRPDLHAQVLAGELTAHAAAVQAGFRHRTLTIRTDDPVSIATSLRRNLKPNVIQSLIELLESG